MQFIILNPIIQPHSANSPLTSTSIQPPCSVCLSLSLFLVSYHHHTESLSNLSLPRRKARHVRVNESKVDDPEKRRREKDDLHAEGVAVPDQECLIVRRGINRRRTSTVPCGIGARRAWTCWGRDWPGEFRVQVWEGYGRGECHCVTSSCFRVNMFGY